MKKHVLFICTGNICRSPMAEGFFCAMAEQDAKTGEIEVGSAGIGAIDGYPPSGFSVDVMREEEIDISGQLSNMLNPELVRSASHIFGMTASHREAVQALFPESREKVFVLREFIVDDEFDLDVPDPIGLGLDDYERTRNLIKEAMPSVFEFICGDSAADLIPDVESTEEPN